VLEATSTEQAESDHNPLLLRFALSEDPCMPSAPAPAPSRCQQLLFGLLLIGFATPGWAISPQTEREIVPLLAYIAAANCEFERNGDTRTPAEAHSHIEMKYRHTRNDISSTEDFIKYAATESSWTGLPYKVRCDGVVQNTSVRLLAELQRIRSATTPSNPAQ
jgi:hypothetical protein